ncbi:MAG: methylated-DNA--[protein]-cysteine S-methyltransferase [Opitutaceae bacterium]|nr:methylated-DNA--[protein]-cysteine S-methyltransferase [Opitutaceae bacterium]
MLFCSTFDTSFGPFSVAVDETGAVVATAFGELDALLARCRGDVELIADEKHTAKARAQITAYLAGKRRDFDLPLAAQGTAFQQRVWRALREVPRGTTRSYGALAKDLRSSARAVGRANATNPICLIVPCHRVIGADGSLTGFAFGEAIKRRLLALEGATSR